MPLSLGREGKKKSLIEKGLYGIVLNSPSNIGLLVYLLWVCSSAHLFIHSYNNKKLYSHFLFFCTAVHLNKFSYILPGPHPNCPQIVSRFGQIRFQIFEINPKTCFDIPIYHLKIHPELLVILLSIKN